MSDIYFDKDGTIRNRNTLEIVGHHFLVDEVRYYALNSRKTIKNVHTIEETSKT